MISKFATGRLRRPEFTGARPEFDGTQGAVVKFEVTVLGETIRASVTFSAEEMKGQPAYSDEDVRSIFKTWVHEYITVRIVEFYPDTDTQT